MFDLTYYDPKLSLTCSPASGLAIISSPLATLTGREPSSLTAAAGTRFPLVRPRFTLARAYDIKTESSLDHWGKDLLNIQGYAGTMNLQPDELSKLDGLGLARVVRPRQFFLRVVAAVLAGLTANLAILTLEFWGNWAATFPLALLVLVLLPLTTACFFYSLGRAKLRFDQARRQIVKVQGQGSRALGEFSAVSELRVVRQNVLRLPKYGLTRKLDRVEFAVGFRLNDWNVTFPAEDEAAARAVAQELSVCLGVDQDSQREVNCHDPLQVFLAATTLSLASWNIAAYDPVATSIRFWLQGH